MTLVKSYYFDYAATTPLAPQVLEAMMPYLTDEWANPSSLYPAARQTRAALEDARGRVAGLLGAKPTEIIFTSGATESCNLAIQGVLRAQQAGSHWVMSAIEHDAVLAQAEPLSRQNYPSTVVPVNQAGLVSLDSIRSAITNETVLVSLMLANNEVGTIQPVAEVAKLIAKVRNDRAQQGIERPLYLHCDATQATNYLDLHVTRLGVDLLTFNAAKMYGPKGIGVLYARHSVKLEPLQYGGGQERGRRSGTENVAAAVGLAAAFELAAQQRQTEGRRLTALRDRLAAALLKIDGAQLNGDQARRLPNNLNFTFASAEGEAMVLYLAQVGIMASTGSACSTGSLDPSHVLLALGLSASEANSSLRLTLGRDTDEAAVDYVAAHLPQVVARVRELST